MLTLTELTLTFVAFFGALITLLSLIGVMRPWRLVQLVDLAWQSVSVYWIALTVRVLLGAALIGCAHASLLPRAFVVLGWLLVLSAVVVAVVGRGGVERLMQMLSSLSVFWMRAWCTLGAVFGASLVYGVMG